MNSALSFNTRAMLLLTAPLVAGRGDESSGILTLGEYKKLARFLRDEQRQPGDLLAQDAPDLLVKCQPLLDAD